MIRRVRQVLLRRKVPELDERLAGMERVFRAPPLTRELVAAIKLISPHCDFTPHEKDRVFWEAEQNGICWGEYEALAPLFRSMPKPSKILEIGPGMGRSLVFFSKKLGWESCRVHTYEGEGDTTRYTLLGPRLDDSFCGNFDALRAVLAYNGIRNVAIFDAADVQLAGLPGPYDLIYSFYSVGFHWSLEHFLDDILSLMHDRSVAVFTIPQGFRPFPQLEELPYRVIDWKPVWPREAWLKLLIIGKERLPAWS
jgi:hypothetical protein